MKAIRTGLGLVVLAISAAGGIALAAEPAPAAAPASSSSSSSQVSMTARFKQVNEKVTTLFQHRNEPAAAVDPRHNPFRAPGSAPVVAPPAEGDSAARPVTGDYSGLAPGSSLALLQQGAATLKVSGIFEIGGRAHLVINSRPYKEGDVVQTLVQGETIYLRVKEISKRSVTLALNDAEMTLKF